MRVEWVYSEYEIIVTEVYRPVKTIIVVLAILTTPLSYTRDPEVSDVRIGIEDTRRETGEVWQTFEVFPPPTKGSMRWPRGT